jgi:23S rRNA pseudouridine2605 synthase
MVLDEGRNREIRRLLARVGHKVQRLKRVAVGPVRLGDLPTGAVRPLTKKEIQSLERAARHEDGARHKRGSSTDSGRAKYRSADVRHKDHKEHKGTRRVIG